MVGVGSDEALAETGSGGEIVTFAPFFCVSSQKNDDLIRSKQY
jgi:hypothetical protein